MKKLENLKLRVAIIAVILLLLVMLATGLLFAYKPDLFTNHNRSVLSLDLNHRNFDIPLNHKYKYYTPTSHTIETENTIEEITEKFITILNTKETIKGL